MFVAPHALTSRAFGWFPTKAGLQTFLHLEAPSHPIGQWHRASGHNGVHCCGTVGDSHSSSQLIAAKRTFTGESRGSASTFTLTLFRITLQNYKKKHNSSCIIHIFFLCKSIFSLFTIHFFCIFLSKKWQFGG